MNCPADGFVIYYEMPHGGGRIVYDTRDAANNAFDSMCNAYADAYFALYSPHSTEPIRERIAH